MMNAIVSFIGDGGGFEKEFLIGDAITAEEALRMDLVNKPDLAQAKPGIAAKIAINPEIAIA